MRFRFIGGLDCPDWVLAQISEFSRIPPNDFRAWCQKVAERLRYQHVEWSDDGLSAIRGQLDCDLRSVKAMIVALGFILEKSAKNKCSADDLEKEMLQLGMSSEHSRQLFGVYEECRESLYESLSRNFLKRPSLNIVKSSTAKTDGVQARLLDTKASNGEVIRFAIAEDNLALMSSELERALQCLEEYRSRGVVGTSP